MWIFSGILGQPSRFRACLWTAAENFHTFGVAVFFCLHQSAKPRKASVLTERGRTPSKRMDHWPLIIVGGGLASALIAKRLSLLQHAPAILVLEARDRAFGEHTWSFNRSDVTDADYEWLAPFIVRHWPGQSVRFRDYRRDLSLGYASLTSHSVARGVARLGNVTIRTSANVSDIFPGEVRLADGAAFSADCVIDARGFEPSPALVLGYQKFLGLEVETETPHGLANPIIMDAAVEQSDGYRFVYVLPFSPTTLLIEDTRYSDSHELDTQALASDISAYAQTQGWSVAKVTRSEQGVLPIAIAHDAESFWSGKPPAIPQVGMRAALFHPTTGYSLLEAVKTANLVADAWPVSSAELARLVQDHAIKRSRKHAFYRLLNRLLFRAALPEQRHLVLQRFYTLSQPLIERFYASRTTRADKVRILTGKPPVSFWRALQCVSEQKELREAGK